MLTIRSRIRYGIINERAVARELRDIDSLHRVVKPELTAKGSEKIIVPFTSSV